MLNSKNYIQKTTNFLKHKNMETPNHNSDIIINDDLYTINWSDIENTEIDYENYLDDIENFFREDFESDVLEEDFYN
ncbi:hypothetical protein IX39_14210 [Chryseobacterium formosense]|uniref:Uncharacterized protein n=2 Tax=Chryseobacterium group TaxID=2782232 RepID=A0A085Z2C0_9FLAO|nr:hypothetical protein IX39_14210 [Chryseobacterium formosense]OCK50481.1 hypothetical protein BA768_04835 [Chryseobacterium sp. CBo1]